MAACARRGRHEGADLGDQRVLRRKHLRRGIADALLGLELGGDGERAGQVLGHLEVQGRGLTEERQELRAYSAKSTLVAED